MGDAIGARLSVPFVDLIGRDTIKQLLALLERAALVLTPDAGPMHLATAVGTPVLGLQAASNPARSGPYLDRRWCVDRYDAAARRYLGRPAAELSWGTKIERPGVMGLISVEDVIERLDAFMAGRDAAGT
jgi:heptosyltransferase I